MNTFDHPLEAAVAAATATDDSYYVALSGGVDSTALLLAASRVRSQKIVALHAHHGLQDQADVWAAHCEQLCTALNTTCVVAHLSIALGSGQGTEAPARDARYAFFQREVGSGCLLLGHHAQDQAETVLLRLIQGRGVQGMQHTGRVKGMRVARPLLQFDKRELIEYVEAAGLSWIEDPSNVDLVHDRNFIRAQLLPLLRERWPQVDARVNRVAADVQQQNQALYALINSGPLAVNWLLAHADVAKVCIRAYLAQQQIYETSDKAIESFLEQCRFHAQNERPTGALPRLSIGTGSWLTVADGHLIVEQAGV